MEETNKKKFRTINKDDKKFIISNMDNPEWSDQKIADHLGISVLAVIDFRRQSGGTTLKVGSAKTLDEIRERLRIVTGEEEKKYLYRQEFTLTERSKRMQKMFTKDDFQLIVEKWAAYKYQLPEMTIAEEDTLEKMLVLDVRMIQNQKSMRACQEQQEYVRKKLLSIVDREDDEIDMQTDEGTMIAQTLQSLGANENELNKNYQILLKEYGNLQESLNATRQQREKNQKVGAETFFDIVKKLSESEVREKVGKETALQKKAMKRKLNQLKKPHEFLDGSFDLPILNADSVKDEESDDEEVKTEPEVKDEQ